MKTKELDEWLKEAACRDHDPDIWFSEHERAKSVCSTCPVMDDCLAHAINEGIWYGIWGGFDPDERKKLAKKRRTPRHGTLTGYTTDGCRCSRCKQEVNEYDRSKRPRGNGAKR